MTTSGYSVFNAMVDIIASPAKALDEIRHHRMWLWWPLLLVMALSCIAFAYYYQWVDMGWVVDQTLRSVDPADRDAAEEGMRAFMTPTNMTLTTLAAIVFMTLVINALIATWLLLANKVANPNDLKFGDWFSLSAWSSFPNVLGVVAMFVVIFMADSNQLAQDALSPLSINSLLIHAEPNEPWFNWGNSLNLFMFWGIALNALGIARWTSASFVKGLIIAALPWVLIFGIWAALVLT